MKAWLCMNTIQTIIRIYLYSTSTIPIAVVPHGGSARPWWFYVTYPYCYGVPQVFKQTYVTVTNLVEGLVTGSGIFMYLYSVHEPM